MKIVFVSNYLSPHQLPFCLAMHAQAGVEFTFVATLPVSDARKALGYDDLDKKYPFVLCAYDGAEQKARGKRLILDADVAIVGTAPQEMIKERVRQSKIVLRFSERQLKWGLELSKYFLRYIRWHKTMPARKPCYLLCASAYAAYDFSLFGLYKNKAYKWGYFPETKRYSDLDALLDQKSPASILWVGRLLDWKRPQAVLQMAATLKESGCAFHVNVIGTGPLEEDLRTAIKKQNLESEITLLGAKKVAEVRRYMEESEIFITTSNRQEGWGAVVNEAMNSACAVVASSVVGAAPYLISHRTNGIIYPDNDIDAATAAVRELLLNGEMRRSIGQKAYQTIVEEWNADVAAERLVALCRCLLQGESAQTLFKEGICSKAPILKDGWVPEGEMCEKGKRSNLL